MFYRPGSGSATFFPDLFVIPVIDLVKYGFIDYRTFQQKMDQVDLTIEQGSDLYCEL